MNFAKILKIFVKNCGKMPNLLVTFAEILRFERCKGMQIMKISKDAAKCVFSRYRSCRYSRERAVQSFAEVGDAGAFDIVGVRVEGVD